MLVLQDCLQLGPISACNCFHSRVPHLATAQAVTPAVLMVFLQADRVAEDLTPAYGLNGGIAKHSKRTHGVVASSDRPHLETIHSLEAEYEIQAAAEAQR